VKDHSSLFAIEKMCKVLKISRSGYYSWLKNKPSKREVENQEILDQIRQIHHESRKIYGSPRITAELRSRDISVSRPRVARLMKKANIRSKAVKKFKVTTNSKHHYRIMSNKLNRAFKVDRIGKVWVSDITYIPTVQGWLYLTIIMDLADRRIIGWSISDSLKTSDTVIPAWNMARGPAVIFATAYDRYSVEGYELSVIDYLLKPFSFTRFMQAVNKAIELIELRYKSKKEKTLPSTSQNTPGPLEFLLINADHKLYRLYLKDILYIQSMKEYVVYFTDQGKVMALGSLKSLEEKLPSTDFIRIHKSYIVAKNKVKSLEGNQLDIGDSVLPLGGNYRTEVMVKLF